MSNPLLSIFNITRAWAAVSLETTPSLFTSAKSRTRRNNRLAIRGVPRERLAISVAPVDSMLIPSTLAERSTIVDNSSTE